MAQKPDVTPGVVDAGVSPGVQGPDSPFKKDLVMEKQAPTPTGGPSMDFSWASDMWRGASEGVSEVWNGMTKSVGEAWDDVSSGAATAWDGTTEAVGKLWGGLTDAVGTAWNGLASSVDSELNEFLDDPFYYVGALLRKSVLGFCDIIKTVFDPIGNFLTVTVPGLFTAAITYTVSFLQTIWTGLTNFFTVTLPTMWSNAITSAVTFMQTAWAGITNFFTVVIPATFTGLQAQLSTVFESIKAGIAQLVADLMAKIGEFITNIQTLPAQIATGLSSVTEAIVNWVKDLPGKVMGAVGSFVAGVTGGSKPVKTNYNGNIGTASVGMNLGLANYKGNIGTAASGQLGDAIRSELKNKPNGSDLVIANSSETIIPASGFPASNGGGGGPSGVTIGSINISGVDNPREIANQVAEEIMHAMQRATYSEINVS